MTFQNCICSGFLCAFQCSHYCLLILRGMPRVPPDSTGSESDLNGAKNGVASVSTREWWLSFQASKQNFRVSNFQPSKQWKTHQKYWGRWCLKTLWVVVGKFSTKLMLRKEVFSTFIIKTATTGFPKQEFGKLIRHRHPKRKAGKHAVSDDCDCFRSQAHCRCVQLVF